VVVHFVPRCNIRSTIGQNILGDISVLQGHLNHIDSRMPFY